jgi:hypothetical protein
MVAGTPPVLPPGYMSLFQAIDCIDPGVLQKGNDQARKDADRFLNGMDWVAVTQHGPPEVPQPVYDEICRRVRRRNAFDRVRDLCAWGTVPSALLPDGRGGALRGTAAIRSPASRAGSPDKSTPALVRHNNQALAGRGAELVDGRFATFPMSGAIVVQKQ